jgi:hypothetical protein
MQPGQFFTEYLDTLPKAKRVLSTRDFKIATRIAEEARKSGVLFALPNHGCLKDREATVTLPGHIFKPPYKICVLEFEGAHMLDVPQNERSSRRVVLVFDREDHVEIIPLAYRDVGSMWHPPVFSFSLFYGLGAVQQSGGKFGAITKYSSVLPDLFNTIQDTAYGGSPEKFARSMSEDFVDELWAYTDFCRVLHENEVSFGDIEPHKGQNKLRRARGMAPLFTYKVLTIGGLKRKSRHLGGTHASPRSHLRRGYYRTSRHGVRHWVQPCMVKGGTEGFVHKDYRVEPTGA